MAYIEDFKKACGVPLKHRAFELPRGYRFRVFPSKYRVCVYGLMKGDNVIYVGCTANVNSRTSGHKKKDYDKVVFITVRDKKRGLEIEKRAIQRICPALNYAYNPKRNAKSLT